MIDIKEIMQYLPHRYPFLLVDKITHLEKDRSIKAIKNVTMNEPFFQGHFPGNPIMPGVLIVEAIAQAAGILGILSLGSGAESVYFLSIEKAKFRKPVTPGDRLMFDINVLHRRGTVWRFLGTATVDEKVVSEVEFTAMVIERKSQ